MGSYKSQFVGNSSHALSSHADGFSARSLFREWGLVSTTFDCVFSVELLKTH